MSQASPPPEDNAVTSTSPPQTPDEPETTFGAEADKVLRLTTELARSLIGAHPGVVSLIVDGDWASARKCYSLSEKYAAWRDYQPSREGKGVHAVVVADNYCLRLTQAELEAHPAGTNFGGDADTHPPMRGYLSVPLMWPGPCNCGLLQLSDKYDGSEFTEEDQARLTELAELAATALNALHQLHHPEDREEAAD